jgi:hypothetical protein
LRLQRRVVRGKRNLSKKRRRGCSLTESGGSGNDLNFERAHGSFDHAAYGRWWEKSLDDQRSTESLGQKLQEEKELTDAQIKWHPEFVELAMTQWGLNSDEAKMFRGVSWSCVGS